MTAQSPAAAQTNPPDPNPDQPAAAGAPAPAPTSRLLTLLHALIDYGKQLADTLQQRIPATNLIEIVRPFGTLDIAHILARITQGLLRAAALEARLINSPARPPAAPAAQTAPSRRQSRAAPSADRTARAADPRLASLPTPDEIAAEVRSRPVGAVIADICRDLGIIPSHPLWRELTLAIIANGGNLAALVMDTTKRLCIWLTNPLGIMYPAGSAPYPPSAIAPGTGPP